MCTWRGFLVVACLSWFGCKKERVKTSSPPAPETPVDDALFIVAQPEVTVAQVPARFTAPLPASLRELQAREYPPRAFMQAALEAGTFQMRRRIVDALARAAAAGAINADLTDWYVELFGYVPGTATCKWLVETASSKLNASVRAVLWKPVGRCRDASLAPALVGEDVPDDSIVDFYFNVAPELPYSDRIARAAANVARTSDNDDQVRKVGFVFARMKGEESIAAVRKLQASIGDSRKRALVGLGMLRSSSAAARAIGEQSCEHPKIANDAMCGHGDVPVVGHKPRTDLAGMIEDGEETKALLAKFPRADVVAALTKCARGGRDYRQIACFEQIADIDRPAALALAKQLAASENARLAQVARSLVKYPETAAAEKALVELGFKLDRNDAGPDGKALTAEDVLLAHGRAHWFDAETGMFPNEHDALLAELAALTAPVLDDVMFEEVPPVESEMDEGPYQLYAYANGKRYAVVAENHGDWYDVAAVIGLVNALLAARRSDVRLAVLPTGDQSVKVIAGPAKGIRALVDARLIDIGQGGEAERVGKEFEDRVFEHMRDAGDEVYRNVPITK